MVLTAVLYEYCEWGLTPVSEGRLCLEFWADPGPTDGSGEPLPGGSRSRSIVVDRAGSGTYVAGDSSAHRVVLQGLVMRGVTLPPTSAGLG